MLPAARCLPPARKLSMVSLDHYLVLSAVLFSIGTVGVFLRRIEQKKAGIAEA